MNAPTVAVIGAGIGGLTAAIALRAKGIDEDIAASTLATIDPVAERERGKMLVATRLSATARLEPLARQRRLVGLLVRRGYAPGTAHSIVRDVLTEDADGGLPDVTD